MTRWILAAIAAVLLTGCATPPPVVEERVTTVPVPVLTYPVKPNKVPALVAPLPPRPADARAAADLALAKVCELVDYMVQADPLLRISSNQAPRAVPLFPECADPKP